MTGQITFLTEGNTLLEVVGESYRQEHLWALVGAGRPMPIVQPTLAILWPEPENPHDPNAIAVWIDGGHVGYLSRSSARELLDGLRSLMERHRGLVGAKGEIRGGGFGIDQPGHLGVFLRYNPTDFGLALPTLPRGHTQVTGMLTGGSAAANSGRLRWVGKISPDSSTATRQLQKMLSTEIDVLDRHFMFSELEDRVYRARKLYSEALAIFDDVIRRHDAEMDVIRDTFVMEFGELPQFPVYRQAAVRYQQAKDFRSALWWAQRGLEIYGNHQCRVDGPKDLHDRVAKYRAKLLA